MSLPSKYRERVLKSGKRWTESRHTWAVAIEEACAKRGKATAAHVLELRGRGSYVTAWKVLRDTERVGLLVRAKDGWRTIWYLKGHGPKFLGKVHKTSPEPIDKRDALTVLGRMREGLDEDLVPARGRLTIARYHVEQAQAAVSGALTIIESSGATKRELAGITGLLKRLDAHRLQLVVIVGSDPEQAPLDLKELAAKRDEALEWDPGGAVPTGTGRDGQHQRLPYGDLSAKRHGDDA